MIHTRRFLVNSLPTLHRMRPSLALLGLLATVSLQLALGATPCQPRQGPHDSIVCVCSATHCDTLDPLEHSENGLIQVWESSRGGKRFERHDERFDRPFRSLENATRHGSASRAVWPVPIRRDVRKHRIQGFGGSFSDAAAVVIASLPTPMQRQVYESFFADTGIEFVFGRVTISGSDFSYRAYSYDDGRPDDFDLEYFALQPEDELKIAQLQLAKEVAKNEVKWFGSSWSPPAWMKTNNMLNGTGQLKEAPGSPYWEVAAKYYVRFLDEYKARGVDMWGMTVQNEPNSWGDHAWNSCAFTPEMERDFIKHHLGPNLWAAGYTRDKFNLMMLDHNRADLPNWVDAVYRDPEAAQYVAGAAIHFYYNGPYGPELFDEVLAEFPDKFILYTESSYVDGLDVIGFGNWWMGEQYMKDILDDITHSVTGWVDWNLALDMEGGPNWSISHRVAPVHVDAARVEWYKNPVWHAMGHFSKFATPGSIHLGDMVGDADDHFKVGVFERPDFGITVIVMNESDEEHTVVLSDPFRGDASIIIPARTWSSMLYY